MSITTKDLSTIEGLIERSTLPIKESIKEFLISSRNTTTELAVFQATIDKKIEISVLKFKDEYITPLEKDISRLRIVGYVLFSLIVFLAAALGIKIAIPGLF